MVFRFVSIDAQIDLKEVAAIKWGIDFLGDNGKDLNYYIRFYNRHGAEIQFDYLFMENHNGSLSVGMSGISKEDVYACLEKVMKIHSKMNGMDV